MKKIMTLNLCLLGLLIMPLVSSAQQMSSGSDQQGLTLITANADEGFELAIKLARRAVTATQSNREVLMKERADYSEDADSLIAVSHVVAVHFQTIAKANNYWND